MAGIDAGSIYSDVRIRLDKLNGDIKSVQTSLDKITKASKKTAKESQKGLGKFFSFIKSSGVGSFLALSAVVAGTVKYLKDSEKAASDAQEVYSKFDTVFESISESANNAADSFAESFGVAGSTARELIGSTGDLLVGMGATEDTALDLSMQVQELASDLASFSNIEGGTKRASEALTAALLGETERMKLLGVVIRQSDVQQRLMEKGQDKLTGQALMLAKAQITLKMATEQSQKAIGDTQRTFNSAANVTKRLKEHQKALREEIGTGIVEAMTPLRIATDKVITSFTKWLKKNREIKDVMNEVNDTGKSTATEVEILQAAIEKLNQEITLGEATGRKEVEKGLETRRQQVVVLQAQIDSVKALDAAHARTLAFEKQYADDISIANARLLLKAQQEEEAAKFTAERIKQQDKLGKTFKEIAAKQALYGDEFDARAAREQAVRQALNEMIEFGFTAEGAGIKRITDQYGKYIDKIEETTGVIEALKEMYEETKQKAFDSFNEQIQQASLTREELTTLYDQGRISLETYEDGLDKVAVKEKQVADQRTALWEASLQGAQQFFSALSALSQANTDSEIAEIDREVQAKLAALGLLEETKIESLQRQLEEAITDGDTETADELKQSIARQEIYDQAEKDKAQVQYKAALEQWKLEGYMMLANTAMAISKAIASAPWPWNLPSIAFNTAAAITQGRAHTKAKPEAPKFATGGIVLPSSGGSLINVAENGSPELMLNSGASGQAMLQEFANQIVDKMGGNQVFYLTLPNGDILAKAVAPAFNNGRVALELT